MAKFYSVVSTFYDNGKCSAFLGDTVEADEIPDNTCKELKSKDVYVDWFADEAEASEFVKTMKV